LTTAKQQQKRRSLNAAIVAVAAAAITANATFIMKAINVFKATLTQMPCEANYI